MIYWQDFQTWFWIAFAVSAIACSLLSGYVADSKGYNSGPWLLVGLLLGIFGLIAAAGLPLRQDPLTGASRRDSKLTKKCPMCSELVKIEASICKFCGHHFEDRQEIKSQLETLALQDEGLPTGKQAQQLLDEIKKRGSS